MKKNVKLWALLLAVIMVFSMALSACNSSDDGNKDDGEEVVIVYGVPSTWNQLIAMNPASAYHLEINEKIYDKLIRLNEDGIGEPRAAKSWSMSDDMKTITFKLQEELYWHDGEKVTSADWLFSLGLMTSEYGSQCVTQDKYSAIEGTGPSGLLEAGATLGVEAPDEYTLVIHLKQAMSPDTFFYNYAAMIYVLPEHLLGDLDPANLLEWEYWSAPVGSGPCRFVSETTGTEIVLEAVDNYPIGELQFDKLIYRVIATDAAVSTMLAGEINAYYYGFTSDGVSPLKNTEGVRLELFDSVSTFSGLAVNNERFDTAFRKAVNYAIDKDLIVESLYNGDGTATNTAVRENSEYCVNTWEGRNVDLAEQYLAESSWQPGAKLSLACSPGLREQMAAIIQQNLADIGIEIEIITVDTPSVLAGLQDGTYDMGMCNYTSGGSPTWIVASNMFGLNVANIIDTSPYVELQGQVGIATDSGEIKSIATEFQSYCDENMPFVPIAHQYTWFMFSDWFKNVSAMETAACWEWICDK